MCDVVENFNERASTYDLEELQLDEEPTKLSLKASQDLEVLGPSTEGRSADTNLANTALADQAYRITHQPVLRVDATPQLPNPGNKNESISKIGIEADVRFIEDLGRSVGD